MKSINQWDISFKDSDKNLMDTEAAAVTQSHYIYIVCVYEYREQSNSEMDP